MLYLHPAKEPGSHGAYSDTFKLRFCHLVLSGAPFPMPIVYVTVITVYAFHDQILPCLIYVLHLHLLEIPIKDVAIIVLTIGPGEELKHATQSWLFGRPNGILIITKVKQRRDGFRSSLTRSIRSRSAFSACHSPSSVYKWPSGSETRRRTLCFRVDAVW